MSYTGTITSLISTIGQASRSNKYQVFINMSNIDEIDILCTEAKLSGLISTPIEIWYRGRKEQIRGESTFNQTWSITFYNDSNLTFRRSFINWMREIHHTRANETGALEKAIPSNLLGAVKGTYNNVKSAVEDVKSVIDDPKGAFQGAIGNGTAYYEGSAKVTQLDSQGNGTYSQEYVGLFPVEISDIDYSDQNSEVTTTTVTFAYSDIIFDGEDGGGGTAEALFGSELTGLGK